jgi:hypothetical protein
MAPPVLSPEDLEAALAAAKAFDVRELPQGRNWLALPDGLCVEVIQATGRSVAAVLAVDPRAAVATAEEQVKP